MTCDNFKALRRLAMGIQRGLPPRAYSDQEVHDSLRLTLRFIERSGRPEGGSSAALQLGLGVGGKPAFGWAPAYPETTGYLLPTLYEAADYLGEQWWSDLAEGWLQWLLEIQSPEGWYPSGVLTSDLQPAVFNTAQVLDGLTAAYVRSGDPAVGRAATRAMAWLCNVQDHDGHYRQHAYRPGCMPAYYARVALPLAAAASVFSDTTSESSARRILQAVCADLAESTWTDNFAFAPEKPAPLHTVAYTVEGMLEGGLLTGHTEATERAETIANRLLVRFEVDRQLPGAFARPWSGVNWYRCITGEAQMAIIWFRIAAIRSDVRALNSALKAVDRVIQSQSRRICIGGIPGSKPFYGRYLALRFPNWAAKFAADAMMRRARIFGGNAR